MASTFRKRPRSPLAEPWGRMRVLNQIFRIPARGHFQQLLNRVPRSRFTTTTPARQKEVACSNIGWFLSGVPAPLPGQSLRTDLARFSASVQGTTARRRRYANFSPVTDVLGRTRRCQRSTCVDAVLPAPRRGKRNYARDFSPRTVGMIANRRFCVNGATDRTGTRCRTLCAKTQIPRRVRKHGTGSKCNNHLEMLKPATLRGNE